MQTALLERVKILGINLSKDITIILIAHRLSTIKECDNIFVIEKGELKKQGKFDELNLREEYLIELNNDFNQKKID